MGTGQSTMKQQSGSRKRSDGGPTSLRLKSSQSSSSISNKQIVRDKSLVDERVSNVNDPRFTKPTKLVTTAGIRKVPIIIPEDSKRFVFENDLKGGVPMCWRLATETAKQFVASGLRDSSTVFTKSSEIHIYFPTFTRYFAVRSFQSRSGFTLAHIMRCVEATSLGAMAYFIKNDLPDGKGARVTSALVKKLLKLYAMCAINIKGNKVYCITADV